MSKNWSLKARASSAQKVVTQSARFKWPKLWSLKARALSAQFFGHSVIYNFVFDLNFFANSSYDASYKKKFKIVVT